MSESLNRKKETMTTETKTRICDIPASCHFSKIPAELAMFGRIVEISLVGWDFIFVLENDNGDPLKIWGAKYHGDRDWVRWHDDEFDYDIEGEAELLWERR